LHPFLARLRWKRFTLAVLLGAAGAIWFYDLSLPWPVLLRWREPGATAFTRLRSKQAARTDAEFTIARQWVPLSSMSRNLTRAVVLAEDGRFYEHDGIDWLALREELRYNGDGDFSLLDPGDVGALFGALAFYLDHRDEIRGRSTITQQLAKNLYFGPERSLLRKVDELITASRLERFLSKDRILELYLNVAEWGPGVFGAEAAAQYYFNRSAADLTRDQAAALAATLPHPLTSNPRTNPGQMEWRKAQILERIRRTGG
jgi:monofunctional biosynthetic peptidoglycan transglycosylase